ncbi:MAG: phage vB SPuM [Verrucomicrobiota bacterium]|jgi:hypothetical protein
MARVYNHVPMPAPERLWELFSLDPFTGDLYWRFKLTSRCRLDRPAGCDAGNAYRVIRICGQLYGAHRLVMAWVTGTDPGTAYIDHWDRNPKNNAPWNLRLCNQSQNMANVPRTGWTVDKNGYYVAQIKYQRKRYHIGTFKTQLEAYTAYITAKKLLFGEFAAVAASNLEAL